MTSVNESSIPSAFRFEQFNDYITFERGLSARTVSAYERDLTRWWRSVSERGVDDPGEVTPHLLREWTFGLNDAGLAATSIRRAQSAVRTYFRFLLSEGLLEVDPTERLESPRVTRKLPDSLTRTEVLRLLDAPDSERPLWWRDRAILELLYSSGLRVSELVDLPLSGLDLDEAFVTVFGKGSKERIVPVGGPAVTTLERYLREVRPRLDKGRGEGRVYLNARGTQMRRESVWKLVKKAARASRNREERLSTHPQAHLRDPSGGRRGGPGSDSGAVGSRRYLDDTDLHPRRPRISPRRAPAISPPKLRGGVRLSWLAARGRNATGC